MVPQERKLLIQRAYARYTGSNALVWVYDDLYDDAESVFVRIRFADGNGQIDKNDEMIEVPYWMLVQQ